MFQLSREVRFAVNRLTDQEPQTRVSNSYAGFPSLTGIGHFFVLQITIAGEVDRRTSYLQNIKLIDQVVRDEVIPLIADAIQCEQFEGGGNILRRVFSVIKDSWAGLELRSLALLLSPFLRWSANSQELPMLRLSQKFEFSASHRLHNPALSETENLAAFGKCSNPHGHGHNYEVQVTLKGTPGTNGTLVDIPVFERVVAEMVIERFDHKNLNSEVAEFKSTIPTVENIAKVIYQILRPKLNSGSAALASVTVWETPKTWCEYCEGDTNP